MKTYVLGFILLCSFASYAKKEKVISPISMKVVSGDLESYFTIVKSESGGRVELSNSNGLEKSVEISKTNYDFLKSELTRLPKESNKLSFCKRRYIKVHDGKSEHIGCLGSPTPIAKKLQDTANTLSLLF
jgi:hypothetical protein